MSKQGVYGFPCVSDPHDFSPDHESCSPEEIETWRQACRMFGTKDFEPNKGCYSEHDETGQFVKHVARTSWGIGTNLIASCDGCSEPWFGGDPPLMTCHECGGPEFCAACWPEHEKRHESGDLR